MKHNIIYNYITTSYFKKNDIDYEERTFSFDGPLTFSIGTHKKEIKRRGRVVGYKIIKPNNSSSNIDTNIEKKDFDYDKSMLGFFAKYFINDNNTPINSVNAYLNDHFLLDDTKIKICNTLYCIQKIYFILSRFVRKIKYTKIKKYNNSYDLYMNPLENYNEKYKIQIIEDNQIYCFKLTDLISIITDSITNCEENFFPSIKIIKNPYTNIPISLHNMYNIYFAIYSSTYITPSIITNYFNCNFDNDTFSIKYQVEIRDIGISNFCNNACVDDLYDELLSVFSICKIINKSFNIDETYPKKELVEIFKPFIKNFLYSRYSINLARVSEETRILSKKLYGFINYNLAFGRLHTKLNRKYIDGKYKFTATKYLNNKYISYHNINIERISYTNYKIDRKINRLRHYEGYSTVPIVYSINNSRNLFNQIENFINNDNDNDTIINSDNDNDTIINSDNEEEDKDSDAEEEEKDSDDEEEKENEEEKDSDDEEYFGEYHYRSEDEEDSDDEI